MDITRKGSEIVIDLDKAEDAQGLFALLTGSPESVSKEAWDKGNFIYSWLFKEVATLASNYSAETAVKIRKKEKRNK